MARTFSFRDLVQRADPDFEYEGTYPVAYRFRRREFRDAGPQGGAAAYTPPALTLADDSGDLLLPNGDRLLLP